MVDTNGRMSEFVKFGGSLLLLQIKCAPCRIATPSGEVRSLQWLTQSHIRQLFHLLEPLVQEYVASKRDPTNSEARDWSKAAVVEGAELRLAVVFRKQSTSINNVSQCRTEEFWEDVDDGWVERETDLGGRMAWRHVYSDVVCVSVGRKEVGLEQVYMNLGEKDQKSRYF